jgi:hypothetical protein
MSERPGNTGLISHHKNYSKNPIPPSRTLQTVEEILPGDGKIFTVVAPSRAARAAGCVADLDSAAGF